MSRHPLNERVDIALLVARAQLGDLRSLDRLLAAVQEPLFHHIGLILRDDDAAADVLQESLLAISRKLGGLRDPRWFRAWAFRIATRLAVRHARRMRRRVVSLDDVESTCLACEDPEPSLDTETLATLAAALDAAPPASQLVLRMHYLEELTCVEIAEALEISVGTVKSRLGYGLAWLRKVVKPAPV